RGVAPGGGGGAGGGVAPGCSSPPVVLGRGWPSCLPGRGGTAVLAAGSVGSPVRWVVLPTPPWTVWACTVGPEGWPVIVFVAPLEAGVDEFWPVEEKRRAHRPTSREAAPTGKDAMPAIWLSSFSPHPKPGKTRGGSQNPNSTSVITPRTNAQAFLCPIRMIVPRPGPLRTGVRRKRSEPPSDPVRTRVAHPEQSVPRAYQTGPQGAQRV